MRMRRMLARQTLDALPDFSIGASGVSFKQSFVQIESTETFFVAPKALIDACRGIITLDINTTVAGVVHDNVTVQIGCNTFFKWPCELRTMVCFFIRSSHTLQLSPPSKTPEFNLTQLFLCGFILLIVDTYNSE